MPLLPGAHNIGRNVLEMIHAGHPRDQAIAAALRVAHRAVGGPAPTAPTYQTAAPAVNAQGYVNVPQTGSFQLDPTTGGNTAGTIANLRAFAQRGLPITANPIQFAPAGPNDPAPNVLPGSPAMPQAGPSQQDIQKLIDDALQNQQQNMPMPNGGYGGGGDGGGGGGASRGGSVPHRAAGGPMSMPWFTRREAGEMDHPAGLVGSAVPGRTDKIPMSVASGSYVVPADVMSGLGEGSTMAGAHALDMAMQTGPGGVRLPTGPHRATLPHPPAPRMARGGVPPEHGGVPVIVAGGEYIIPSHEVERIGAGDMAEGHRRLDRWVVERRKRTIKQMKALPGPVKS